MYIILLMLIGDETSTIYFTWKSFGVDDGVILSL